jgi:hypothetical protein
MATTEDSSGAEEENVTFFRQKNCPLFGNPTHSGKTEPV